MSGWLEFFEEEIKCPHCQKKLLVQFYEDGDPNREPLVVTGLAGVISCQVCEKNIKDEDIRNQKVDES